MGLITDFTSLISETKLWLENTNTSDDTVKGWIQLAESKFRRELATLDNEVSVTSVPSDEFDALPVGFNGLREAFIVNAPDRPLTFITPSQMTALGTLSGEPVFIAVVSNQFKFKPSAAGATVTYNYFRKLADLSDASPTNYLILEFPDVYLSATLAVAQKFLRDDVDASQHIALVDQWIQDMQDQDSRRKWAGQVKQIGVNPVVARLG